MNRVFSNGNSILIHALEYEQVEIAYALIEAGADIDARTHRGATPLLRATDCLKHSSDGDDAYLELFKLLINAGADLNAFGPHDEPPVMGAVYGNETKLVRLLLEAGASCGRFPVLPSRRRIPRCSNRRQ